MADPHDFAGDNLKLAAYLRLVQQLPPPPRRCRRRRRQGTINANHVITADNAIDTSTTSNSEEAVILASEDMTDTLRATSAPKQQQPAVYASRIPKADPRRPAPTSTSWERRLPANELALVRATTADGLPDRSDEVAPSPHSITELDPIEDPQKRCDGQLPHNCDRDHFDRHDPTATPASYADVSDSTPVPSQPFRCKRRQFRKLAIVKPRSKKLRLDSDTFVGEELLIPPKPKVKKRAAQTHKRRHLRISTACLPLGKGSLPEPSWNEVNLQPTFLQPAFMSNFPLTEGTLVLARPSVESKRLAASSMHGSVEDHIHVSNEWRTSGMSLPVFPPIPEEEWNTYSQSHTSAPARSNTETNTVIISSNEEL